jgi:hypothetical protein
MPVYPEKKTAAFAAMTAVKLLNLSTTKLLNHK